MRVFAFLIVMLAPVLAFPRLGLHEGFTRLVFDLNSTALYQVSQAPDTFTIRFSGISVSAADVAVGSPQVASYQVVPASGGATAFVRLRQNVEVRTSLLNEENRRRLIVDVVTVSRPVQAPPPQRPQPPQARTQPRIVVLDAGHGGVDPGAVGFVVEEEVTLDLAFRVQRLLRSQGIEVILTRASDTHLSRDKATDLRMRADMANSMRTLFVSIHVNSAYTIAQGIEVFYFGNTIDPGLLAQVIRENGGGEVGRRLTREAQSVADRLVKDLVAQSNLQFSRRLAHYLQGSLIQATGAVDRGVRQAPFFVIRNARTPPPLLAPGLAT
ncbi:N-acetylmuramoyl-L-alanine amidase, partial [uncultured Meiothermus sp.]|uniref:N-acetylmuramoyl-L-alanine amidase family protein n=1 Tax=uncultured Meiothermus sp. TaxID=157471 RepID=UPI002607BCC1